MVAFRLSTCIVAALAMEGAGHREEDVIEGHPRQGHGHSHGGHGPPPGAMECPEGLPPGFQFPPGHPLANCGKFPGGHPPAPPAYDPNGKKFPVDILGGFDGYHCPGGELVRRTTCQTIQPNLYERVTQRIGERLTDDLGQRCTATDCERGDFAGCIIRLVGHDLMDFDPATGEGGNDACINFEDPDNTGLHDCLDGIGEFGKGNSVEKLFSEFCHEMSLADFMVVLAESVMINLRPDYDKQNQMSPTFSWGNFKFGRETKETCNPGALPDPTGSCVAVKDNFIDHLGLDWTGSAALMGVHTLGRAKVENSGYDGWWTSGEDGAKFDNFYYISMLGAGWVPVEVPESGKGQWVRSDGGPPEIMLNTDICMLWTTNSGCHAESLMDQNCCLWASHFGLQDAPSICVDGCRFDTCCRDNAIKRCGNIHLMPKGSAPAGEESAAAIIEFAKNETAWLIEFKKAWRHVTTNGKHDLFTSDCVDKQDEAP